MPPNTFFPEEELADPIRITTQPDGPFASSQQFFEANKKVYESFKELQKTDVKGFCPHEIKWLLGDLEIGILKSSIDIQAKAQKLLNLSKLVREAVDDNTRPTAEFLESINLGQFAEALSGYTTVEDFTDGTEEEFEEIKSELEELLKEAGPRVQRKRLVREIGKCRAKKDGLPELIYEMKEALRDILDISEKMANDFPTVQKKMRSAIDAIKSAEAKSKGDQNYYSWAKWICGGLCAVAGVVTLGAVIAVAGAAISVSMGVAIGGVGAAAAIGAGYRTYRAHNKGKELVAYLQDLGGMTNAMDVIHGHVMKREKDWTNHALGQAKQTETDQDQLARRVVKLPSSHQDKQRFREDLAKLEETLERFSHGMTLLKDAANRILDVLHQ